ncbi:MAG: NAD(+) diphosphatase [Pseudomonadales bacterium]|nr:NAD(+) diphosphatase [Pseudomonadales bacterium]
MDWTYIDLNQDYQPGHQPPANFDLSYHIIISDGEILAPEAGPFRPMTNDEIRWIFPEILSEHCLGMVGGVPLFVTEVDPEADEPEGYEFGNLWSFLGQVDEPVFYLLGKAKQITEWHHHHQFCGQCGQPTEASDFDRSRRCRPCGQFFYPRLSPSIIVLITRGEELLLARNAQARGNFYSTLAGFVEPGESLEEAVHREVMEEVGVKIRNLKYYNSQSWPFPNSLMLGFHAEYDSGDITIQEEEIAHADFFHYRDLPSRPAMMSISGWLIQDYIDRLERSRSER